jgi:hypothetical protein
MGSFSFEWSRLDSEELLCINARVWKEFPIPMLERDALSRRRVSSTLHRAVFSHVCSCFYTTNWNKPMLSVFRHEICMASEEDDFPVAYLLYVIAVIVAIGVFALSSLLILLR